ncbi:MAG: hypothetical protein ACREPM_08240 [Gemmatimonadaceae bacterium]
MERKVARDPKELVLAAFAMARESGKEDWWRMTAAVLKNRLLALTRGEFNEHEYGATGFLRFLGLAGDAIRLDRSSFPPIVELKGHSDDGRAESPIKTAQVHGPSSRIRPDLWQALLDYSSGHQYVWDRVRREARQSSEVEEVEPRLPTLSRQDHSEWRAEFARAVEGSLNQSDRPRVDAWKEKGLPAASLPPVVRGQWTQWQKERVEQRARAWFREQNIDPPADLMLGPPAGKASVQGTDEYARQFALDCVRQMTTSELLELNLPLRVVLRVREG